MSVEVNTESGIWLCDKEAHSFDEPLAMGLTLFFQREQAKSILDIGCGSGAYVNFLRKYGLDACGIDGNPKTVEFSEHCSCGDILDPKLELPRFDWVLSLEVGEHIPPQHEQVFIDRLVTCAGIGIILSWFPVEGHGIGHFNPKPNDYIKEQVLKRGFISNEMAQKELRESSSLWWFGQSLMTFRRI